MHLGLAAHLSKGTAELRMKIVRGVTHNIHVATALRPPGPKVATTTWPPGTRARTRVPSTGRMESPPPTDRRLGARISVGRFGQLDHYPPCGWRVVQDIAASASSIPSERTELCRLFRETIPDCTLQCGPTKRGLSTCAKLPSLCVSSIRLYSRAANMHQSRSASSASAYSGSYCGSSAPADWIVVSDASAALEGMRRAALSADFILTASAG